MWRGGMSVRLVLRVWTSGGVRATGRPDVPVLWLALLLVDALRRLHRLHVPTRQ